MDTEWLVSNSYIDSLYVTYMLDVMSDIVRTIVGNNFVYMCMVYQ